MHVLLLPAGTCCQHKAGQVQPAAEGSAADSLEAVHSCDCTQCCHTGRHGHVSTIDYYLAPAAWRAA